jgi:hypothetical protein
VADVGSLIDCLCGIDSGEASMDDILDKYDEVRRQIFHQVVDVTSKANFHRIMQDTEADENDFAHKDPLFQLLAQARKDPSMAASLLKVSSLTSACYPSPDTFRLLSIISSFITSHFPSPVSRHIFQSGPSLISFFQHELSIGCDMTQFYVQPSAKVVPSMVTV